MTADVEKAERRPRGIMAPPHGCYVGTVEGHHALFTVTADGVNALWFEPRSRGDFRQDSNAWDVEGGRFLPHHGSGSRLLTVQIRKSSRKVAPGSPGEG